MDDLSEFDHSTSNIIHAGKNAHAPSFLDQEF